MRHVVGETLIPETIQAINEMELKRVSAEQKVDAYPHANVDKIIPSHLIEQNVCDHWTVISMLFFDACELALPHILICLVDFSDHVPIDGFVHS